MKRFVCWLFGHRPCSDEKCDCLLSDWHCGRCYWEFSEVEPGLVFKEKP